MSERDDAFANTLGTTARGGKTGGQARAELGPIPEVLSGRYRMLGELGAGGFGVVYEAQDERLQKRVAVKVLGERHSRDKLQVERFRAEALTAGKLDHASIVAVTDFDILDDGRPYLVMELVEGRPFNEIIEEQAPFDIPRAARIARRLCLALATAHKHGIVHRDLKPANIIADGAEDRDDGTLKILDFGVAKLLETRNTPSLTHTGQMLGTPAYMAPEQVRQRGTVLAAAGSCSDHRHRRRPRNQGSPYPGLHLRARDRGLG